MTQCGRGEINRRYPPSVRGEPERVGPMTAACIERASWLQARDFTGGMSVRGTMATPLGCLYNTRRRHSRLGYLSPADCEEQHQQEAIPA